MLNSTLYLPGELPQVVSLSESGWPVNISGFATIPEKVPVLLNCKRELVDVLAIGKDYVAYSVFDCEDGINPAAMQILSGLTGLPLDIENEDEALRGPVLVIVG